MCFYLMRLISFTGFFYSLNTVLDKFSWIFVDWYSSLHVGLCKQRWSYIIHPWYAIYAALNTYRSYLGSFSVQAYARGGTLAISYTCSLNREIERTGWTARDIRPTLVKSRISWIYFSDATHSDPPRNVRMLWDLWQACASHTVHKEKEHAYLTSLVGSVSRCILRPCGLPYALCTSNKLNRRSNQGLCCMRKQIEHANVNKQVYMDREIF